MILVKCTQHYITCTDIWFHSSFKIDYRHCIYVLVSLSIRYSHALCSYRHSLCFFLPIPPSLRLSSVAEDTIRAYFESRLVLLEPVFPLACHRLCEGPDFSLEFGFKSQQQPEGKTQTFNFEVICVNSWFVCLFF